MNKVKVRCAVCGKSFKTPSLKKTICPSCEAEAKRARHQAAPAVAPKPAQAPTSQVDVRAALRAAQENQGQFGAYRPPAPVEAPPAPEKTVLVARGPAHGAAGAKPPRPGPRPPRARAEGRPGPMPPREKKVRVPTPPFVPTAEQIQAIRERYMQLARPEYDGIRHQIATEMGIPLRVVKQVVKDVRAAEDIQSWWERSGAVPSPEMVEQIRALYLPLLPEPEVGVHKRIAAELKLTNTSVYQAIGQIRTDLQLPRYNPREEQPPDTSPPAHPAGDEQALHATSGE